MDDLRKTTENVLALADLAGVIITIWQFVFEKDYSIGTLVGVLVILLTILIGLMKKFESLKAAINNMGYGNYPTKQIKMFFVGILAIYCFVSIIIYILCFLFESSVLGVVNIFGLPIALSLFVLIIKIFIVNFDNNFWQLYKKVCPVPVYLYSCIVLFSVETLFDMIICIIACLMMCLLIYALSSTIYNSFLKNK